MTRKTASGRQGTDTKAREAVPEVDFWTDTKARAAALRASRARQSSKRRRLIDPTTCDRDYSAAEVEFMQAIQTYKHTSGRMYPTWSEVLEVLMGLGYQKAGPASPSALPG